MCRAEDLSVPPPVTYVVAHCGTINLDHNEPKSLANAITILLDKSSGFKIVLTGPIPRDLHKLSLTYDIIEVNSYLKKACSNKPSTHYSGQDSKRVQSWL